MGDVGDYWHDVHAARKAAGLPARRRPRPKAIAPTKAEISSYAKAGFEQKSEWHWQTRLDGDFLDYWPSKSKWRWREENFVGLWKDLVDFLRANEDHQ